MTLSNEEIAKKVQKALTLSTMSNKEKQVQIALGTLDIPELIPINLSKVNISNSHPDIVENKQYLVHIDGEYLIGYIDCDNGEFCIGPYAQAINDCDNIWAIKERSS